MRIIASVAPDETSDVDFFAARRVVGAQQPAHPIIVTRAIGDDHFPVGKSPGSLSARLEQVRIHDVVFLAERRIRCRFYSAAGRGG